MRSPSGWIYYYVDGLVVTPLGDIWFERIDRSTFFSWFRRSSYESLTKNEVRAATNAGSLMYINMDSGFAWVEIFDGAGIGSTFENGVIKPSEISY